MSSYTKPHLTFEKQLELLKSRGLIVADESEALTYLRSLGYYRLSGYWYPFRELIITKDAKDRHLKPQRKDTFIRNSEFQHVVDLCLFDKKLRLLLLDAIERVEIAIRVSIAHLLGKYNLFAHIDPKFLHGNFTKKIEHKTGKTKHQQWLINLEKQIKRSKEDFVQHYKDKYGPPLPIWVAVELWDFGMMSMLYQGMHVNDKEIIAKQYGIQNWQIMESWLRCLNFIRNAVAHHNRLWNRVLTEQPKLPRPGEMKTFDPLLKDKNTRYKIYIIICILMHLLDHIDPKSELPEAIYKLIDNFPIMPTVGIENMGVPHGWKQHNFWNKT